MMNDHRFTTEGLKENDDLRAKIRVYEENVGKIVLNPKGSYEQEN